MNAFKALFIWTLIMLAAYLSIASGLGILDNLITESPQLTLISIYAALLCLGVGCITFLIRRL